MFKKLCSVLLVFILVLIVSACGSSEQPSEDTQSKEKEITEAVSGGWELFANEPNVLPDDVQTAFDKAVETFTGS